MRSTVLTILLKILYEDQFSNLVLSEELKKHPELSDQDKRFIEHLTRGVVERKITLDAVIDRVSSVKTKKMKPAIACILYMGAYQILYMHTESYAAVDESVKLAVKRGYVGLKGFVNGVLRRIAREGDSLLSGLSPWQEYSISEELYKKFLSWYPEETVKDMCAAFLSEERRKICIRRNTSRASDEELLSALDAEGIRVKNTGITDDTYFISGTGDLSVSEAFLKGWFYVQDISSALAGDEVKDLLAGDRDLLVLDACAAPGGKSIHAADLMRGRGSVTACDVSEKKVGKIRENIARSGFENMSACVRDARVFFPEYEEKFDLLLLDVPCSGLGIIGNKPDIRLHVTDQSLLNLVSLQKEIFRNVYRYVKKGGTILYSTCTVNPQENGVLVEEMQKEFGLEIIRTRQLLPGKAYPGTGFYTARLRKHD